MRSIATALVLSAGLASPAWAIPLRPVVVTSGSASFVTNGSVLDVGNSFDTVLDWTEFSIATGETVNFNQPDNSSAVLLRIIANNPTVINGSLRSNGSVYLTNSAGFLFGSHSLVNVYGLDVSTGGSSGRIYVNGAIKAAPGGWVRLTADYIGVDGNVTFNGDISAVPEPDMAPLFLVGLAMLGVAMRRQSCH